MESMIRFVAGNFTLDGLVLGLVASVISLLRTARPWTPSMLIEAIFSYFVLFSIALIFINKYLA